MADDNGNGIRITNREIYDMLVKVQEKMNELSNQKETVTILSERVRALELRWYGVLAGILAAIGTILYETVAR